MLELVAYSSMFIDHILKFLKIISINVSFKEIILILGRIAMPIFAYLIAKGLKRTEKKEKYILRLFIFAMISQIPFILMVYGMPKINASIGMLNIKQVFFHFTRNLNIGFTFLVSMIMIFYLIKQNQNFVNRIIIIVITCILAEILNMDYGMLVVLLILSAYYSKKISSLIINFAAVSVFYAVFKIFTAKVNMDVEIYTQLYQLFSLLSLPIIVLYEKIEKNKRININTKKEEKQKGIVNFDDDENKKKRNKDDILMKEEKRKNFRKIIKYSIYPLHMFIIFIINFFC